MSHPTLTAIAAHAEAHFDETLAALEGYLRLPAISCDPEHHGDVRALAALIRDDLERMGFERARVCELDDALPMVAAEHLRAGADRPTVLIYGHLDLQPVRGEVWATPPHEPSRRDGRLYARGAADDMGGWVSHLAAIEAWLAVAGELPVNVKLVIEGEEEIGSPNLERFMDAYPEVFESDVMVLTDCENPSTDIPGLTVSLRGLYEVELVCEALTSDVHSGLWGNMAPDVSTALVKLLARLFDDDGRFLPGRQEVPASWRQAAWEVPLDDEVIRSGAHLAEGVAPLPHRDRPPAEWLWRQPACTVLSTTLPTPDRQKNALRARAGATLSIRVAPGQTHDELRTLLEQALLRDPPGGVKVSLVDSPTRAESWLYEPQGPAFAAADRAYQQAWGRSLLQVGVGGSIPFVALFGRRFGDLPLILNGVMDPDTGAHGPDESMHLEVFRKAILANVHLLDELSRAVKPGRARAA
jgi:acetylornithine deacetylase/succinyl-diaminopimelate desuccinylase-like protein